MTLLAPALIVTARLRRVVALTLAALELLVCAGDKLRLGRMGLRCGRARLLGEEEFRARQALDIVAAAASDQDLSGRERRRDRSFPFFDQGLAGADELRERVGGRVEEFRAGHDLSGSDRYQL